MLKKNYPVRIMLILLLIYTSQIMMVDAKIPVTYSCCRSYDTNNGTLLYDFENINDWELNGLDTSYIVADSLNFKEGKQGLKMVAKNGNKVYATRNIDKNFSDTKNFVFDIYIYDTTTISYITLYITSHKDWSKYFYYTIDYKLPNGWNRIVIKKSDMFNHGRDNWNNDMKMLRFAVYPINGKDANITIDNFRYDVTGRAKLIFNFDDGTIGDILAEQILTVNNQVAMSFIVISWLGYKDFMTLYDLKRLQDLGWDISSHTISHPDLTLVDDNNLTKELNNSYDWFINNGFQKTAGFLAYPYGYYNDFVIEKTKRRYILARSVTSDVQPHMIPEYRDELYKLKIIEIQNNTPVQLVKHKIDVAIDHGQLVILLFHRIVRNNPSRYEYLESDFKQISDYVKSRESDIDVITFSDYMIPNINDFTPVINKTTRIYYNGTVTLLVDNKYDEYMPNMTIRPLSGSVDILVSTYDEKGDQFILFNESKLDPSIKVRYSIGDRIPGKKYSVKIYDNNSNILKSFYIIADNKGYIKYHLSDFESPVYTEIRYITSTEGMTIYEDIESNKNSDDDKDNENIILSEISNLSITEYENKYKLSDVLIVLPVLIILIIYFIIRHKK